MGRIYELVRKFPEKIKESYNLKVPKTDKDFNRIVFVGMGGNYIAGQVLREFLRNEIQIDVFSDNFKSDDKTLIILASYSGDTREVINIFNKFRKKDNLLVVSSGGELLKKAEKKNVKLIRIPPNINQRFTFAECFFPILKFLEVSGLVKDKSKIIKKTIKDLNNEKSRIERDAINLAILLKDEHPLFYSSNFFYPSAYRMQTAIEEDAKIICHSNKITELFHNELEALPASYFYPVLILDDKELNPFKKQIKFFKNHIKEFYEIGYKRYPREERMFFIFYFIDFLGYHLSRLKMTDMGETPLSDKIKKL